MKDLATRIILNHENVFQCRGRRSIGGIDKWIGMYVKISEQEWLSTVFFFFSDNRSRVV